MDSEYTYQTENDSQLNGSRDDSDCDDSNAHPILKAAESGSFNEVVELLQEDKNLINICDEEEYTPLHRACQHGRVEMTKFLLENGANVFARTVDGWQPIHTACQWGYLEIVKILLAAGADINSKTKGGNTPLHLAVSRPKRPLLEYLLFSTLEDEIDLDARNDGNDCAHDILKRTSGLYKLWDLL